MTTRTIPQARALTTAGAVIAASLIAVGIAGTPALAYPAESSQTSSRCASTAGSANEIQLDRGHYRLTLAVGAPEDMYTQAQVDAQGITDGELMIAGKMNSPMDMGMGAGKKRHVEVSICDIRTGKIIQGGKVRMSIAPKGGAYMPMVVAEMRGLDEPPTMAHYGNNVTVPKAPYKVKVRVGGQAAVFHVTH